MSHPSAAVNLPGARPPAPPRDAAAGSPAGARAPPAPRGRLPRPGPSLPCSSPTDPPRGRGNRRPPETGRCPLAAKPRQGPRGHPSASCEPGAKEAGVTPALFSCRGLLGELPASRVVGDAWEGPLLPVADVTSTGQWALSSPSSKEIRTVLGEPKASNMTLLHSILSSQKQQQQQQPCEEGYPERQGLALSFSERHELPASTITARGRPRITLFDAEYYWELIWNNYSSSIFHN
ncbi:collagen alpha-1(I) chain-like [Varanus komodoensis]|uniref:collagen alpha-1(I) chain-like n=1 Tax=Varanus komodoensis TaxID=61221 RepID=UPI001CF76CCF|nr:collagen alpha-1(I) chain-like [Varanus komodoensis]